MSASPQKPDQLRFYCHFVSWKKAFEGHRHPLPCQDQDREQDQNQNQDWEQDREQDQYPPADRQMAGGEEHKKKNRASRTSFGTSGWIPEHLDVPWTIPTSHTSTENTSGVTRCGGHDVMTAGTHETDA